MDHVLPHSNYCIKPEVGLLILGVGEKRKARLDDFETLAASLSQSVGVAMLCSGTPSSYAVNFTEDQQPNFDGNIESGLIDDTNESATDALDAYTSACATPATSLYGVSWDLNTSMEPSHLFYGENISSSSQNWSRYIDCGCLYPHLQVSSSRPRVYLELEADAPSQSSCSTDPDVNTLRIERYCIVQSMTSLCLHIGMTKDMLCDDKATSPFFRPTGKIVNGTGADTVVKMVQTIFKTLKPDMRPTREQIIRQHAAFIDVLPFPTLRRNVINSGEAVDLTEFYHDLIDGLICWGGATDRSSVTDSTTGDIYAATPWDSRSWEARGWFLRKYWALLGGEEGELVRQSEWWRNMRGDDTDLWFKM